MNERTPVSAFRLLSSPCNKSIVFISSRGSPCIFGLRYWKNNLDLSLIFSVFLYIFKYKGQKKPYSETFGNSFETLVTLISKWPGIEIGHAPTKIPRKHPWSPPP